MALSAAGAILAVIGLLVGLVVLGVVIWLLRDVLAPLLRISADVENAETAPMLKKGIPGTDQLGQTRRLAESVPPLALAYLDKLALGPRPAAPAPPPPAPAPAPAAAGGPSPAAGGSSQQGLDAPSTFPAWKGFG
ncbi:MAG: hypothetical protein WKF96_09515 [Solirubrobacteraceae bacterium]